MTPPHAGRISGVNLIIQSKIKRFELLHPVPIALSNISVAIIVAVRTIIASTHSFFWMMIVRYEGTNSNYCIYHLAILNIFKSQNCRYF
jgi:hypothetical protein